MPRSYFFISRQDFSIFEKEELYQSDAVVIDVYDASYIFNNVDFFQKYLDKLVNANIEIYLKLDTRNIRRCYYALNETIGSYFTGWAIPHSSPKLLNKLMIKVREYEFSQKLDFGSLKFIAIIDTPEGIINYRKIAAYERVESLYIDEEGYRSYLGFNNEKSSYLRKQIAINALVSKKPLIDSSVDDDIENDLIEGFKFGATAKATKKTEQISFINNFYTPRKEEIEEALEILKQYKKTPKKERKYFSYDNQDISSLKIKRCQELINRACDLGLINETITLNLIVKDEEVKEKKQIPSNKKFYTLGEEIASSITHGVGIVFSLVMLIMLLIKGFANNNPLEIVAYVVYALSALLLYVASTLYHGLPLGSSAKRLFHRFDHMTIYLLIAGTYTPFTLLAISGNLGIGIFIGLWSAAIVGFILNLFWFGKFKYLHIGLYLLLGWTAIFFIRTIINSLSTPGIVLLFAGGVAYTLGIIFYSLKLFKFTHMIWHLFVLLGTLLHFLTVFLYM